MLAQRDPLNIIITGVGGQGNLLASQIMGRILMDQGLEVIIGETLGLSQRGGSVTSHVRASAREGLSPIIPAGMGHLVLALEPVEGLRVLPEYGRPDIMIVANTRPVHPIDVLAGEAEYPPLDKTLAAMAGLSAGVWTVDATDMALEMGNPILANIVLMGAAEGADCAPFDRAGFKAAAETLLPADKLDINLQAYDRGVETVRKVKA